MSGILAHDAAGARRLTLALLLALGLHAALLLGIPADGRRFHSPVPRQFDVVLLPPAERSSAPEPPTVAPEPAESEAPGTSEVTPSIAVPSPALPTPPPVVVAKPASQPPAAKPVKPPVVAKIAPPSPRPVKPTVPAKSTESAKLAKPPAVARIAPSSPRPIKPTAPAKSAESSPPVKLTPSIKPAQPTAPPTPVETRQPVVKNPARRLERSANATASNPSGRLDSGALLGQIASLDTETQRRANAGVRSRRVNPNDTQSLEGFYIAAWIRKVERIGETNFPEVARKLNLSAGPVLDVHIGADGSLRDVRVARSSGNAELDQAAQRIVRLGDPYAPFPPELRQKWDILQISRPWRFDAGGQFQAR